MSTDTAAPDAEKPAREAAAKLWQKQLAAIGLICTRSAKLDNGLEQLFCELVESKYARVIASGENNGKLLDH
jgi:hypothetical protein